MPEAVAQPRYLVDDDGEQVAVLVDIEQYRVLLEAAEELDAIRAYDAPRTSPMKLRQSIDGPTPCLTPILILRDEVRSLGYRPTN